MTNPHQSLAPEYQAILLRLAGQAIEHGLRFERPLVVDPVDFPAVLQAPGAVFVTLTLKDDLRGCVGTLESGESLVVNTARYAYAAAFSDTRFEPLTWAEFPRVKIRLSLLSELEPIRFRTEAELLDQIRPGIDGLFLEEGSHRGTLLPSVWADIPEAREFLRRLKLKAGLATHYWSDTLEVRRYTTVSIPTE